MIVCASWGSSVSLSGKPKARPGRGPSLTYRVQGRDIVSNNNPPEARHHSAQTHLDQGHSVPIRACYWDVNQRLPQRWSLAFFGPTIGAIQTIIWAEVLVLGVDVLALLAWLVLATGACQVHVVGVEAGHGDWKERRYLK